MFTRERLTRWTNALRAHPEQQGLSKLTNENQTELCCLGKLCQVEGLEFVSNPPEFPGAQSLSGYMFPGYKGTQTTRLGVEWLFGDLAKEFGSCTGSFNMLGMPFLDYDGVLHPSAAYANDQSVPWSEIADHFDKYYPCEDEIQDNQKAKTYLAAAQMQFSDNTLATLPASDDEALVEQGNAFYNTELIKEPLVNAKSA